MTSIQATVEVFWTAFQAMKEPEKEAFIAKLLEDEDLAEDMIYSRIVDERKSEETVSLDDYLSKR